MNEKEPKYLQHGTYNCYMGKLKCRCDKCKVAHSRHCQEKSGLVFWQASEKSCASCGLLFLPKSRNNVRCKRPECVRQYGADKSRQQYEVKKLANWSPRKCQECGQIFSPGQPRQARIPKRCKACRLNNPAGKKVQEVERRCFTCTRTFMAKGTAVYCQDICNLVGKKIRQRIREQQRRQQGKCGRHGVEGFCDTCHKKNFRKVQVRKRAYAGKTPSALELARAQRWKCVLCGGKLSTQHVHPHALSLSIDHTIPRSLGGTDDPANLTAAHLICNVKKNNGVLVPEQLRLVG